MTKSFLRTAVNLDGKHKDRFLKIKEKLGVKSNTEVFRWLIKYYCDKEGC